MTETDNIPITLDSINELQADMNAAISKFTIANEAATMASKASSVFATMLIFPWYWIVDQAKRPPEDWVNYVKNEIDVFHNAMLTNPLSIAPNEEKTLDNE